ncbi:hypothetical protein [Piscirickettsia salmonis]|uniref:hypothetical protein n=1 Tax=Piscirickettsia salmonis TaxID=1238 RepID=UPI0006BDE9E3|nr:hypothetical protein [Piscirickettsia salmonis]ALA26715.1 hypothetical protein KW89_3p89 [Piscirickettsia salmonis]APS45839.1 hypothetical protein AVI48_15510 [Piscirickettsia salmonis]APS49278.1 hypothetical protein AVI49_16615 [Piscirickettsia salmonis]QGO82332.1 hypothetical protein Psal107_03383 [Piscirickettsia salmonis]QGP24161.1 hypothetical protein Psal158_03335 [Piscirickettsia salmonis]
MIFRDSKLFIRLTDNFKTFIKEELDFCKLLGFKFDYKKNEVVLHLKMLSSLLPFTEYASKIAASDDWIEGFSRNDVRLITFLACCDLSDLSPVQIHSHRVVEGSWIVKLYDSENKETQEITTKKIVGNKILLSRIPQSQQKILWYLLGLEENTYKKH